MAGSGGSKTSPHRKHVSIVFRVAGSGGTLSITHIFAIDCSRGFDESRGDEKALRAWGPLLKPSRERKRADECGVCPQFLFELW